MQRPAPVFTTTIRMPLPNVNVFLKGSEMTIATLRISWSGSHVAELRRIYAEETRHTVDQLGEDNDELQRITEILNAICGTDYPARPVVLHKLKNERRKARLARKYR